ncbi:MAG: histidine kinase [Gammaproteobacteria bacterium]|jgi:two-component system nitrate/nitrite sensor histidine kinase NarX/two-component system sensor histidine kinase UhpB
MVDLTKLSKKQLIKQLQAMLQDMERAKDEGEQQRLIHDLRVHQIELEMQNRELRETQHRLELSRDRYSELYDFAPVGYVTLTDKGLIEQINLIGAKLLGKSPEQVINLPISAFVSKADLQHFFKYLKQVFDSDTKVATELRLKTSADCHCHVYLESIAVRENQDKAKTCRSVIVDITKRKQAEEKTQELLQQNRSLTQRLFKAQEQERRHLARELHDEFGQWLTAIQLNTQNITNLIGKQSPDVDACIVSIANSAAHIQKDIRGMIHSLWPALLDELGLADSLRDLVAQWQGHNPNINCMLNLEGELDNLGETLNITLYRLVQEGLTNVSKHAHASHVAVALRRKHRNTKNKDNIMLTIEDDGKGFDPNVSTNGFGLVGMRERVLAAGGDFSAHASRNQGMRLEAQLFINPLESLY